MTRLTSPTTLSIGPERRTTGDADAQHQGAIGLILASLVIGGWLFAHISAIFLIPWGGALWLLAPFMMAVLCWLYVGLFIVAHDCMHGSLVPFRPAINRNVGRLCLFLYAGFSFDAMITKHHDHHRHSGTGDDPDFHDHEPHAFWPWYMKFFLEYFSWKQIAIIAAAFWFYALILGAPILHLMLFWTVPAVVSSLQLFTFGTYLPHRPAPPGFSDRHNARTNDYPAWLSLLTCFHFGYHHEHHLKPGVPWWRLPAEHAALMASTRETRGAAGA
ncbi:MAG: fatty acid desaturase [Pseudomonadota bacterium]